MAIRRPEFPLPAVEWLTEGSNRAARVLALSSTSTVPKLLIGAGLDVVVTVRDREEASRFAQLPNVRTVVAHAEALPFATHCFGTVVAYQMLHRVAPGLAMPEIARVLVPKGHLAACYFIRDDSVPWVKRLVAIMREASPSSMQSSDVQQHQPLTASKYFTGVENKDFRVWVPIARDQLVSMVTQQPEVSGLGTAEQTRLMAAIGGIYDTAASGGQLRLPYQLRCWRAVVDHAEFTRPVRLTDDGLSISL